MPERDFSPPTHKIKYLVVERANITNAKLATAQTAYKAWETSKIQGEIGPLAFSAVRVFPASQASTEIHRLSQEHGIPRKYIAAAWVKEIGKQWNNAQSSQPSQPAKPNGSGHQ